MNQNETIIRHDESVAVDAELFPRVERKQKNRSIVIYICRCVNWRGVGFVWDNYSTYINSFFFFFLLELSRASDQTFEIFRSSI